MPNWQHIAYQSAVNAGHPKPHEFVAQMMQESGLRPGLTSSAGAQGIAQIMPATAKGWGVDPNDPVAALNAAAKAMTKYYKSYNGNSAMALAAYNAGPGAVAQYNGVPPYSETRNYIKNITASAGKYLKAGQGPSGALGSPQKPAQGLSGGVRRPYQDPTALSNQINRIQYAYMDAPDAAKPHVDKLMAGFQGGSLAQTSPNVIGNAKARPEGAGFFKRNPGETFQVYMDRLLQSKFGLRHDPGNSQTTGGRHMAGSAHYRGGGTDYGNALNKPTVIDQAVKWTQQNADKIVGFEDVIWQDGGAHDNHGHWEGRKKPTTAPKADLSAWSAGAPPTIKPTNVRRRPRKRTK